MESPFIMVPTTSTQQDNNISPTDISKNKIKNSALSKRCPKKVSNLGLYNILQVICLGKFAHILAANIIMGLVEITVNSDSRMSKPVDLINNIMSWLKLCAHLDVISIALALLGLADFDWLIIILTGLKHCLLLFFAIFGFFKLNGMFFKVDLILFVLVGLLTDYFFIVYTFFYFDEFINPITEEEKAEANV